MKNLTKSITLFFTFVIFLSSCSLEKKLTQMYLNSDVQSTQHQAHNGAYKHCSLCVSTKMGQTPTELPILAQNQTDFNFEMEVENETFDILQLDEVSASNEIFQKNDVQKAKITSIFKKDNFKNSSVHQRMVLPKKYANNHTQDPIPIQDYDKPLSGMALVGFILGLIGLILALIFSWSFFLGLLGIIFSSIGLKHTSKEKRGKGLAVAGLVLSILAVLIFWALIFLVILFLL